MTLDVYLFKKCAPIGNFGSFGGFKRSKTVAECVSVESVGVHIHASFGFFQKEVGKKETEQHVILSGCKNCAVPSQKSSATLKIAAKKVQILLDDKLNL